MILGTKIEDKDIHICKECQFQIELNGHAHTCPKYVPSECPIKFKIKRRGKKNKS